MPQVVSNDAFWQGADYDCLLKHSLKFQPSLIAVRGYKPVNELRRQAEELGIRYVRVFNDQTEA